MSVDGPDATTDDRDKIYGTSIEKLTGEMFVS